MIDSSRGFTIVRNLDAEAAAIWSAWTDPDEAAQWWHPHGMTTPRDSVEIDARAGGRYRYTMVDDTTAEEFPTGGVYREVEPKTKLVFTWGEPDADPDDAALVTVTIQDLGGLARLTFDLRGENGMAGDDSFFDGWASALDELVTHLGQTAMHG